MHSLGFHKQTLIAFLNGIGAEIHTENVEILHLELPAKENGNPEQKKWNWENLKKFPILKEIFVSGISLPNFFPFLAHLPQLKKVKLTAYELSNLDFSSLGTLDIALIKRFCTFSE